MGTGARTRGPASVAFLGHSRGAGREVEQLGLELVSGGMLAPQALWVTAGALPGSIAVRDTMPAEALRPQLPPAITPPGQWVTTPLE